MKTDASVAKAFGYKRIQALSASENTKWMWRNKSTGNNHHWPTPPRFTTSLDAIVSEIESRGVGWQIIKSDGIYYGAVGLPARKEFSETTAPLALCAALLAYLKENK